MGKARTSRSKKRKYYGNQHVNKCDNSIDSDVSATASSSKLCLSSDCNEELMSVESKNLCGNRIIDIEILIAVLVSLCCPICFDNKLVIFEDSRFGLSSNLTLKCKSCSFIKAFCTSKKDNKQSEINTRFVFGLRLIGKGYSAAKKLCTVLNLPPFLSKLAFRKQEMKLLTAATSTAEHSMNEAAIVVKNNNENKIDCGVSVDGTWQRRGFSSLNGCVSVISIDTGKILDIEAMSKYCRVCSASKDTGFIEHVCKNHNGSAGSMEPIGVQRIFERSEKLRSLHYTSYYGDGDSKAYSTVKDTYGANSVVKLECIGHIQKRVGSRLRKLKISKKGLGGKGKLTDSFIDRLQNYYGIAIRSNVGNIDKMQSAVIAAFYHCCSSSAKPKHGQCPIGVDSWCKYQRAKFSNAEYTDKSNGLPDNIINIIKPTYFELCERKLLQKCLHGKTQNANEAFNGVLWQIAPKETFVELATLSLCARIAVIQFNEGYCGLISMFKELNISPGRYTLAGQYTLDTERIEDCARHSSVQNKCNRRKLRAFKKRKISKCEKEEGTTYKKGEF